jgi:hypothetical protein
MVKSSRKVQRCGNGAARKALDWIEVEEKFVLESGKGNLLVVLVQ